MSIILYVNLVKKEVVYHMLPKIDLVSGALGHITFGDSQRRRICPYARAPLYQDGYKVKDSGRQAFILAKVGWEL
jgi:hypothetical protein